MQNWRPWWSLASDCRSCARGAAFIGTFPEMTSWSLMEVQVEHRAGGRCEYCQMHQSLQGATFHVEHIVPRCRGGSSDFDNLAWACPSCNLHKSDRVSAVAPGTDQEVSLFHPRVDRWHDHFCWEGYRVVGRTLRVKPRSPPLFSITNVGFEFVKPKLCSVFFPRTIAMREASIAWQAATDFGRDCLQMRHTTGCRKRGRPAASITSTT